MITLNNMIYANPQAYQVFPEMVNPANTGTTERAEYSGYLDIVQDGQVVKQFTGTNSIDLSEFVAQRIRIDNVTDRGSVVLGEWDFSKDMSTQIMSSMVLWYDLKRQGATNESMAADPTLRDLSGNGHDATCYNFAWSGMSGIGGRPITTDYIVVNGTLDNVSRIYGYNIAPGEIMPEVRFKVTGITGNEITVRCINSSTGGNRFSITITDDGEYSSPSFTNDGDKIDAWEVVGTIGTYNNVVVEILPQYPHALVSDGVDDYAMVEGLPLFTTETGYTVIAKRKIISYPYNRLQSLVSKRDNSYNGAFTVEAYNDGSSTLNVCYNFGSLNKGIVIDNDELITWQTSGSYNGQKINIGNLQDTDFMLIFSELINSENRAVAFNSSALYSLLLFNRDLTVDEINWVKTNLIS